MPIDPAAAPYSASARPELTGGVRVGVLLSHGFTGSPFSMRPWAEFLAEHGYAVEVPLLPGHGTTWQEMNRTEWQDWYDALGRSFDKLQAENDEVVVAGLSMGGALVLKLAADRPDDVRGVVLVNAAIASSNKQLLALPLLKRLVPSIPGLANDIKKQGVEEHGYDRTPLRALASLVAAWKDIREGLGSVKAPILLFRSTVDHVVDPSSAALIQKTVGSTDVRERLLEDSYHVATLDNDAPVIFEESLEFIRRVTGAGS